jgi:ankyrin repeat protein
MTTTEAKTALFEAIRAGDLGKVQSLLTADPSLAAAKNEAGVSAVLLSIYTGRNDVRELLLQNGAALEFHEAAAAGKLDRVKEFTERDGSLAKSFSPDGFPVFALSCFFGHLEVARYLAEKGADIHAVSTNGTGYNALTASVAGGHTELVKWLLACGMDENYLYGPGYTPLLTASANGNLEIVKLLLAAGADPYAKTNDGKSALDLATERKHAAVSEFMRSL